MFNSSNKTVIALFAVLIRAVTFASASRYFSDAKLHPNCLKVEPTSSLTTEWGLQLFAGARFYIPYGNSKAIQRISQLIFPRGKDIDKTSQGPDKLECGLESKPIVPAPFICGNNASQKMCAQVRIKGFMLQMEGHYDHFLTQDCSVIKKGANHCVVNPHSEAPDVQKEGDGIFTIVWTDNKQSMAVVRCSSNGLYNDWYVFSFQPTLNETDKATVLSTMNGLGFPDTMADTTTSSYEGCELFDPEEDD